MSEFIDLIMVLSDMLSNLYSIKHGSKFALIIDKPEVVQLFKCC
jgi:hypothetical protein